MQRVLVQEGLTLSSPGAQVQLSFAKRQALAGSAARLGTAGSERKNRLLRKNSNPPTAMKRSCWKELPEPARGRCPEPSLSRVTQAARRQAAATGDALTRGQPGMLGAVGERRRYF